ncbi:MAG: 1-phosphofructokinase family hexose kinase [Christensenellales bacterium]
MIYTMTLHPAVDKTAIIPNFTPGRVNRITQFTTEAGGKGINVVRAIHALGGECLALGIVGGDTGAWILEQLDVSGIAHDFCQVSVPTRTNLKVVDPEQGQTTDINEPGTMVPQDALEHVLHQALMRTNAGDMMVLSGSLPSGASIQGMKAWIAQLIQKGVRVCLDAEGGLLREWVELEPFLIKPNQHEFAQLTGVSSADPNDIAAAVRNTSPPDTRAVVSLGADGAVYVGPEGIYKAQALPIPVMSTVGAGDTLLAALALGADRGWPVERALRTAMAAAALWVSRAPGTQPDWGTLSDLAEQAAVTKISLVI